MANHHFTLFPGVPPLRDMFDKRHIRYQWRDNGPVFTSAILLICVAVWVMELLLSFVWPTGLSLMLGAGTFRPVFAVSRPWTFVTSLFLHQPTSILHILFNMLALWSVGPVLEKLMGHWPFLALYAVSGIGGSLGMMVWSLIVPGEWLTGAYGASGALFGLFAAMLIVYRRIGADISSMVVWMVINFMLPVVVSNIAWQAHVGGFLIGGLFTWLLVSGPRALRGKSLKYRTAVYGGTLLVAMIVAVALVNVANPASLLGLLMQ